MIDQLKKIFYKKSYPLNKIEISRSKLISNYKYLSTLKPNFAVAPVLKSNAYGHGLNLVAKILDELNPPFFCVDSLYEAYLLKKAGINREILIMGHIDPESLKIKKMPFQFAVFNLETLKILNEFQKGSKIHIFVDTGMHREGINLEELPEFLKQLKKYPNLRIEGLMSHLASTESVKDKLFLEQLENFKKAKEILKDFNIQPKWFHLAATGALTDKNIFNLVSLHTNLARGGKALYGYTPHPNSKLQPILKLTTKLAQIKILNKGDRVGYDGSFEVSKKTIAGVLPIGYHDGVDRRLSNIGFVKVKEKFSQIIGRVSMNVTTIDLTKVKNPKVGDEVIIYSDNPSDLNSIENAAKICGTISYELLVHLIPSTKRIIVE
ncbi:alanine racemase [Candidatus Daviesbacteria bacterium]|nr:alanine racemase [Candidatus Daviesbacteria bacterium]